jgi:hypothetical protein
MRTSLSNTDTNPSNSGRVQGNPQTNGNSEVTVPDNQRAAPTAITDSNRPSVYVNQLPYSPTDTSISHLAPFYDNPQTNGKGSKA